MALTMEVLAARIRAAMRASGMSQRALGLAIGMDPATLSKALAAKRGFTPLELALISDTLGIPVQQLLASDETGGTGEPVHVRVPPDASPAADQALDRVQQMLELDDLLSDHGFSAPPMARPPAPSSGSPSRQGETLAQRLRLDSGLGDADLPVGVSQLTEEVEDKLGIDVAIEPLERGLDGLTVSRPGYRLIMVSSSVAAHRQRYTLAHELGHLMAGDQGGIIDENINDSRTPEERRANAFAAAFLMPAGALRAAVGGQSAPSENLIADLLGRLGVSVDALALRLRHLDIINTAVRDDIRRMSSARIALRRGGASDLQAYHVQRWPGGLVSRAVEAYAQGQISIRPIAQLINVAPDALLDELAPPRLALPADLRGFPG